MKEVLLAANLIFFYIPLYLFSKEKEIYSIPAIILLYILNYFYVENMKKITEISNNILAIILKILIPFYSLKIILHKNYKDLESVLVMLCCSMVILYIDKNKILSNYNLKKIKKKTNIYIILEFLISLLPLYLLKTGSIKILPIMFIVFIYRLIIKKEKNIKEVRVLDIVFSIFFLVLIISSYYNGILYIRMEILERILFPFFILLMIIQFRLSIKEYKNIIFVSLVSVNIFYLSLFQEWIVLGGGYHYRLGSFIDITQTGVILGILQILLLFYILAEKKWIILFLFIINFNFLILTGSKGPLLLSLLLSIFMGIILLKKRARLLYILTWIIFVFFLINTDIAKGISRLKTDDGSTAVRKYIYLEAFKQFKEKPILGYGLGTYKDVALQRNQNFLVTTQKKGHLEKEEVLRRAACYLIYTHSNVLELARGSGILSVVFYYCFIVYLFYLNIISYLKTKNKRLLIGIFSLIYFEIYGMIDNNIIYERLQTINFYILSLIIIYIFYDKGVENERNNTSRRKWNKTLSNNKSNIKTDKSNI